MATNQPEVKVRISAEGSQEVVSALKRIQSQAQQTAGSASGMSTGFEKIGTSMKGAAGAALALTAAVGGIAYAVQGVSAAISAGFDFNRAAESAPIAFAALISSQAKLEDSSGKLLKGQEAYNAALVLSRDLYQQLLIKGQETAASNEQLINAFQITLSSGLAAGVTDMGQLLNLSTAFLQTATAMQVPLDQMRQEISSILTAQISSDSVIGKSLGITNEQVKKAKEQGTLVQLLNERMAQFVIAAKDANGTLDVMLANTKEALSTLAGRATRSLFDGVKQGLSSAFNVLIDKSGKLTKPMQEFADLTDSAAAKFGGVLGSAVSGVANMINNMVAVYKEHQSQIDEINRLFGLVFDQIGNVFGELKAATAQTDMFGHSLTVVDGLARVAVATFSIMADAIGLSVGAVKLVGAAISRFVIGTLSTALEMLNKVSKFAGGPEFGKGLLDSAKKTQASLKEIQDAGATRLLEGAKNTKAAIAALDAKATAKAKKDAAKASVATPKITGALRKPEEDDKKSKAAADKAKREAEALAKAQLDATVAAADREQKLADAQRALMSQKTKEQYDAGLLSLEQYHAARINEIKAQYGDEIKLLEARKAAEAAKPVDSAADKVAQAKEIANIENDIAIKRIEQEKEIAKVSYETAKQKKENALALQEAQQQLLEKTGKVDEAARMALDIELAKQEEVLSKAGMTRAEREAYIATLRKQGEAVIALSAIERQSSEQLRSLDAERERIQAQVATGKLFSFQAEQQIAALEQSRIPALRELAKSMMELAKASGDAMQIQRAEDFARQIDALEVSSDVAGKKMGELVKTIEDGLKNSIKDGLMSLVDGNMSVADSFKSLARSVVGSLQEMLAEMIAVQAQQAILGSLGLGGGAKGGGGSGFLSSALSFFAGGFAEGGQIQGPGTGTSDSMIARVSNGEFVVNAAATRENLALLHAINNGQSLRKFATGGLVETAGAVATSSALGSADGSAVKSELGVTLDDGLVLRYLNTSAGQNAVVNIIQRNKNKINSTLRG